ncbi:segregation/condensation protein A [Streptomyces sp. HNM0645]|uniref:segregation and condensation protein A n=1 Tax=Streptomyces sp. HNM0645 TaxID=2782343 RepID=UPI0024B86DA5|nr:segregation/condensation protein A [Streptomyces sp. HNM0645]MDI9883253.1 segregation/condensation protein A [Streptomyces sp. HNM0645]
MPPTDPAAPRPPARPPRRTLGRGPGTAPAPSADPAPESGVAHERPTEAETGPRAPGSAPGRADRPGEASSGPGRTPPHDGGVGDDGPGAASSAPEPGRQRGHDPDSGRDGSATAPAEEREPAPAPVRASVPVPVSVPVRASAPAFVPAPVPPPAPQEGAAEPAAPREDAEAAGTPSTGSDGATDPRGRDGGPPPGAVAAAGSGAGVSAVVLADTVHDTAAAPDGSTEPHGPAAETVDDGRFTVRLANFEGPFDLLLQLISKHKLDVTEVALSKVTDEFMAHIRAMGPDWDLDQTTEFLVVAATLLDLKAARLLPAAEVEDEADLALLEARDLLFARLLQYRAYKQVAEIFAGRLDEESRRYPRTVGLEDHHAELLPDVVISIGAEGFAKLAVKAMQPRPKPQVYVDHIHAPLVSVREQAEVVVGLLRERGRASFRELTDGVTDTLTVVARFLALLELYRERAVVLDQEDALGELVVTWAGGEAGAHVTDEFDRTPESMEDKA